MFELKLRAWNIMAKKMLHFVNPIGIVDNEDRYGIFMPCVEGKMYIGGEYKLMRYTGLSDKNKIPIYESDIVRDSRKKLYIVEWADWGWINRPINKGSSYPCFNRGTMVYMEIVGNKWDNSDLLEVAK